MNNEHSTASSELSTSDMPDSQKSEAAVWTSASRKLFLFGLLLVVFAQYLMLRQKELIVFSFTQSVQQKLYIDIPYLDNVILAIALLLIGTIVLMGGMDVSWSKPVPLMEKPISIRSFGKHIGNVVFIISFSMVLFAFVVWQSSDQYTDSFLIIVWIISIILAGYVSYLFDRSESAILSPHIKAREIIAICSIMFLGFLICSYNLQTVPNSLVGDEGAFWETARAIAIDEYKPSVFALGVYSFPVMSSIAQGWVLKLFGLSLWSWRFSSVIAAIFAVPPTYLLARELFGGRIALLASLVMISNPFFIAFARLGYNNSQALFPVALTLYFTYVGMQRSSALYLFLGGVIAGLGFYTYTGARLGFFSIALFFLAFFILYIVRRLQKKISFISLQTLIVLGIFFISGCILTVLPHIIYANKENSDLFWTKILENNFPNIDYARSLFNEGDIFRDYPPIRISNDVFFYRFDIYMYLIARGFIRTFLSFYHNLIVSQHYIRGPLTGFYGVIFYTIGMAVSLAYWKQKNFLLLLLCFISGFTLLSALSAFPPRQAHMVPIIPAMAILMSIGIVTFANFMAPYLKILGNAGKNIITGCFIILLMSHGVYNYFVEVQSFYKQYPIDVISFKALELKQPYHFVYVYHDPKEEDFNPWVIRNMPHLAVYETISREKLQANQFAFNPSTNYMFFFYEEDEPVVSSFLNRTFSHHIAPVQYFDADKRVVLMSYMLEIPADYP